MSGKAILSGLLGMVLVGLTVACAQAETITHGGTTLQMDFVNVGNVGNEVDNTGYGEVNYAYRIGKYEVTVAQWAAVIAADSSVGNAGYWSGSQPTGGTTWSEAAKFCNWLTTGNANTGYYMIAGGVATPNGLSHEDYAAAHGTTYFIPTEDEWYKAAYYDPVKAGGAGYWDYPTRSDARPTAVMGSTAANTAVYTRTGTGGVYPSSPAAFDNAGGLSAYGTMGQGGNVWEWNEALNGSSRGMRGAFFGFTSDFLLATSRNFSVPSTDSNTTGFRVASIPEPCGLAMLAGIAVAGLLCYWRRGRH